MRIRIYFLTFILWWFSQPWVALAQNPCATLAPGTYTVGSSQAQFATLEQALAALRCGGSTGPVVLQLLPGVYGGHYRLDSLPGNLQHQLVLRGGAGVRIERLSNGFPSSNLLVAGGRWRIEQLHFVRNAFLRQAEAMLVIIAGRAPVVVGNQFTSEIADNRPPSMAIRSEGVDSLRIDSNRFLAWSRGLEVLGGTALQFNHNQILGYSGVFLHAERLLSPTISHNQFIDATFRNQEVVGIALEGASGMRMFSNRFSGSLPSPAFQLVRPLLGNNLENRVFNNEVNGRWPTEFTAASALVRFDARASAAPLSLFVAHNSFRLEATARVNDRALIELRGWRSVTDTLVFANNVVVVEPISGNMQGSLRLVYADTLRLPGIGFFNNGYFSPDSLQAFATGNPIQTASFSSWRNVAGYDAGSRFAPPLWQQPSVRLQPSQQLFNNAGVALGWPTVDLLGTQRSTPPDMGAIEFEPAQRELRLSDLSVSLPQCGPASLQAVSFSLHNLGTDAASAVPVRLLRNGLPVSFLRVNTVGSGQTQVLVFPDLQLLGGSQAVQLAAYIDTVYDLLTANDTSQLMVSATESVLPVLFDLQNQQLGSNVPGSFWQQQAGSRAQWQVVQGSFPGAPLTDASGNEHGRYLWLHNLSTGTMPPADTVRLEWPCLAVGALANPAFAYDYFHPQGGGRLEVWALVGNQWTLIDSVVAVWNATYTRPWQHRRAALPANIQAIQLRMLLPAATTGIWALDNLRLYEAIINDIQLDSLTAELPPCSSNGEVVLAMRLTNNAFGVMQPMRAGGSINGSSVVFATANRPLLPGSSDTLQLRLPFNQWGRLNVEAFVADAADEWRQNDTLRFEVQAGQWVTQYNYVDDFESPSAWFGGGQASSWQAARPAGMRLQAAGSGQTAWVTNPNGLPNANEQSWLQSPCFNFSSIRRPQLRFLLWHHLSPGSRVWVEYQTPNNASWLPLGAAFTGSNWYNAGGSTPGWQGQSAGWVQVSHPLDSLIGISQVSFRIRYAGASDSLLLAQPVDGVAIDQFRIVEDTAAYVLSLQAVNDGCTPAPRNVTATLANALPQQQVDLKYRVNGGAEQNVVMQLSGTNTYTASLPAQAAGDLLSYRVLLNNSNQTSETRWYRDGFFAQQLADQNAPSRELISLDAQLGQAGDLGVATTANDTAFGAWFELEALRYTELEGLWVQVAAFTSLRLFGQVAAPQGDSLRFDQLSSLATAIGVGPGSVYMPLARAVALRPGEKLIFYVQAAADSHLRVLKGNNPASYQDAQLRVRPGRWLQQTNLQIMGVGIPSVRVVTRNPASLVRWTNRANTILGDQNVLQTTMGLQTDTLTLRLERGGCAYLDTIVLRPTGQFDLAVTQFLEPDLSQVQFGVFYPVKVVLANRGNLAVSEAQLAYRVNGAELAVSQLSRTLSPNDTLHFTFPQLWTWVEGNSLTFCAYPRSFNLDVQRNNDTTCISRFPTSVGELSSFELSIYPQPAHEKATVRFEKAITTEADWILFDAFGRKVLRKQLETGTSSFELNLGELAAGMYYYQLSSGGQWRTGKLILQ